MIFNRKVSRGSTLVVFRQRESLVWSLISSAILKFIAETPNYSHRLVVNDRRRRNLNGNAPWPFRPRPSRIHIISAHLIGKHGVGPHTVTHYHVIFSVLSYVGVVRAPSKRISWPHSVASQYKPSRTQLTDRSPRLLPFLLCYKHTNYVQLNIYHTDITPAWPSC